MVLIFLFILRSTNCLTWCLSSHSYINILGISTLIRNPILCKDLKPVGGYRIQAADGDLGCVKALLKKQNKKKHIHIYLTWLHLVIFLALLKKNNSGKNMVKNKIKHLPLQSEVDCMTPDYCKHRRWPCRGCQCVRRHWQGAATTGWPWTDPRH